MRIANVRAAIARWGSGNLVSVWLYRHLGRPLGLRLYVVNMRIIDVKSPIEPHIDSEYTRSDLEFKRVDVAELYSLSSDESLNLGRWFLDRALSNGDFCIGAFLQGQLVTYAWRSFGLAPEDWQGVAVRVKPPYCYTYKVFTRPEFRGQGIWPALSLSGVADQTSLDHGCDHLIGFVEIDNLSSLGAVQRIGAIQVGYAGYLAWGRLRWMFHDAAVKRTQFRFVPV